MLLAYVDESGDTGAKGSLTFTLGCILSEASKWPDTFDELIDFRRFLRTKFGIPVRTEIKANYLVHQGKSNPLRPLHLSEAARFAIYRQMMRLQPKLGFRTFAVVIRKDVMATKGRTEDPREVAWEYLLQRLERVTTKGLDGDGKTTEIILIHDEGYEDLVRRLGRKARRAGGAGSHFGTGHLRLPARRIIDDPVPRNSQQSYFLQLADVSAYAAFRRLYPPPPRPVQIVPHLMWDELWGARYSQANQLKGGPSGIVSWP